MADAPEEIELVRTDDWTGPLLEATDIVAGYVPEVNILNGCSLTLYRGELVGIIGPNGAGKSTLLKALFGLIPVRRGSVRLRGENVTGRKAHALVTMGLGYVPQTNNVFPRLTVQENLEMGMYLQPRSVRRALRPRVRAVPAARAAPEPAGRLAVGRRAADGGDGPGADDGAVRAAARRAVGRTVARSTRTRCSSVAGRSTTTACRSSWSSRTRVAVCRSATAATCSTRARTRTPGRATSCSTTPRWSSSTSARSPGRV